MNKHLWLASLIVILALDGCSPVSTSSIAQPVPSETVQPDKGKPVTVVSQASPSPVATVSQGNSTPTVAPVPSPARTVQSITPNVYDPGKPTLRDVWLDPINGKDSNSGASRDQALRTITAAWNRIPEGTLTTTGYRLLLTAGDYAGEHHPGMDRVTARHRAISNHLSSRRWSTHGATTRLSQHQRCALPVSHQSRHRHRPGLWQRQQRRAYCQ